jgi:hypothetical protein
MKFDGCEVREVQFSEIGFLSRFFTDNGEGYAKTSDTTCVDDYSQNEIRVDPDSVVWIKTKR